MLLMGRPMGIDRVARGHGRSIRCTQLNVVTQGEGTMPVVLLHDADVAGGVTWDGVVAGLDPRFAVMRVDLPGFGLSERLPTEGSRHTVASMAEEVADVIRQTYGDRVVIAMENRPEWCIAELAILSLGAIAVPAYTTNTADDHQHILNNVRAKAALVSTRKLAANLLPAVLRSNCDFVVAIEAPHATQQAFPKPIHLWDEVLAKGDALPDDIAARVAALDRREAAVIIHTSGTGGAP